MFRLRLLLLPLALTLALVPRAAVADEGEDQYALAAGYYARQRWDLAAEQFRGLLKEFPDHPRAARSLFFLGEALVQLGRFESSRAYFLDYLQRDGKGPYARQALFRAGESAFLGGKLDQAAADLAKFRETYPGDVLGAHVASYLGEIAIEQGDTAAARRAFEEGLAKFADSPQRDHYRLGLARTMELENRPDEAIKLYRLVAATDGSALADKAQFLLGTLQYAGGDLPAAERTLAELETKFRQSPYLTRARLNRGWALYKTERYQQAADLFATARRDEGVAVAASYGLGLAQHALGQHAAAAKTLLEAARGAGNNPLTAALRFHAGDALLAAGDTGAAAEQFKTVLANHAGSEWADDSLLGLVRAAHAAGDHREVQTRAAQFSVQFGESDLKLTAQRLLGRSLVSSRQHDKAVALLGPLSQGTGDVEDDYLLALALRGAGRDKQAIERLSAVIQKADDPVRSDARLELASLLRKAGRYEEAIAPLKAVLAQKPDAARRGQCLAELAVCHGRTKRIAQARDPYEKLIQEFADSPLVLPTTLHLAEAAYAAGEMKWAAELFTRLAADGNPADYVAQGRSGLAWCQIRSGDLVRSADTFQRLLREHPDSPLAAEAALARAQALAKLDRPDAALVMYRLVLDRYPQSAQRREAMLAAARLHDRLQQDRRADALYTELLNEKPAGANTDVLLYERSWVLRDLKRTEEADDLLRRIHEKFPHSGFWADAAYRLAERASGEGKLDEAAALLDRVIAAGAEKTLLQHALYLRGQVAARGKKWDAVQTTFARLVKEYPQSSLRLPAEYWIAEATYRQGDYDAAGDQFERLAAESRGRTESWLAMIPLRQAQVLAQRKKWTDAYDLAESIERDYPEFGRLYEVYYLLGRCHNARGQFTKAREMYQRVLRWPAGRNTETAAMAQWMIGESYFHQKNYETAEAEYLKVDIRYKYPRWQAGALLQAGKCNENLGRWPQAIGQYDRILKHYPDTTFTQEADRRLRVARQRLAAQPL